MPAGSPAVMIHAVMALFSLAERRIEEAIARRELDDLREIAPRALKKLALLRTKIETAYYAKAVARLGR